MSQFIDTLRDYTLLADGALGSYLFERTGRLSEQNHLYETFNLERPDLVHQIHLEYLQAGARCLTTNSFAANKTHLPEAPITRLNEAGAQLAREAIDQYRQQSQSAEAFFVLGSVGPTLEVRESPLEARDIYREQIEALTSGGVDALLLETFTSLLHVAVILEILQEIPDAPPAIVHMALHQVGDQWDQDPQLYAKTAADLGAQVLGVNCCTPAEARAFFAAVQELKPVQDGQVLLSAMPNGGDFQRIGHRYLTGVNPEFMGRFAREMSQQGVRLVGGCCEVHPPHIHEMHNYLHSLAAGDQVRPAPAASPHGLRSENRAERRHNGPFSRKIIDGEFATSVELLPPRGTGGLKNKLAFIEELAASGLADALDLTDGSRGIPLMPPGDFAHLIRDRLAWQEDPLELIPHFTTRDLNVMGLQSRLIGYWANRIRNVLFVTGDPPKMSPTYPRSTAIFDLDSVALIRYTHAFLNAGLDFGGQPLGTHKDPRTRFTIGTGCEPEALDLERELDRLRRKIDAGADYVMTQPAFNFEALQTLEALREKVPIVVGVLVLRSLEHARRIDQVPGVSVPEAVFARLGKYAGEEDQAAGGVELAAEQVRWVRDKGWAGLYLMSPSVHGPILDVLSQGLG
jgi:homocysteine S-methyltransferase